MWSIRRHSGCHVAEGLAQGQTSKGKAHHSFERQEYQCFLLSTVDSNAGCTQHLLWTEGQIHLVNAKGLQNPEGMGQGYVRVRVRVQNSEPSTNPYPYGRVEGFPGVGETEWNTSHSLYSPQNLWSQHISKSGSGFWNRYWSGYCL